MGCFDTPASDKEPLDLSKLAKTAGGGVSDYRNSYGALFRSRGFLDTSLQSHAELPDPLWTKRMVGPTKAEAFAIRALARA